MELKFDWYSLITGFALGMEYEPPEAATREGRRADVHRELAELPPIWDEIDVHCFQRESIPSSFFERACTDAGLETGEALALLIRIYTSHLGADEEIVYEALIVDDEPQQSAPRRSGKKKTRRSAGAGGGKKKARKKAGARAFHADATWDKVDALHRALPPTKRAGNPKATIKGALSSLKQRELRTLFKKAGVKGLNPTEIGFLKTELGVE